MPVKVCGLFEISCFFIQLCQDEGVADLIVLPEFQFKAFLKVTDRGLVIVLLEVKVGKRGIQ